MGSANSIFSTLSPNCSIGNTMVHIATTAHYLCPYARNQIIHFTWTGQDVSPWMASLLFHSPAQYPQGLPPLLIAGLSPRGAAPSHSYSTSWEAQGSPRWAPGGGRDPSDHSPPTHKHAAVTMKYTEGYVTTVFTCRHHHCTGRIPTYTYQLRMHKAIH